MRGRILRLSIKPETPGEFGLPKRAVRELAVTAAGADGDYNRYRTGELPGDREQALLLMTQEVLDTLRAEGWPVEPGDLGENVTLGGVAEASLSPGVRLSLGGVEIEISKACDPCTEVYSLPYIGPERGPAFVRTLVGRRGWYARVLTGGRLDLEAPVEIVEGMTDVHGSWETEAEVTCPYCGQTVTLELDAGSGDEQEYVEDCQVCCQPWQVHVHYDAGGAALVTVEEL